MAVVGVFNNDPDTIVMLRTLLELEGFETVSLHIEEVKSRQRDVSTFVEQYHPAAIVYDLAPPYRENWDFLLSLRRMDALRRRPFVLTTTNKPALEAIVGETYAHELISKPYEVDDIIAAVRKAVERGRGDPTPARAV